MANHRANRRDIERGRKERATAKRERRQEAAVVASDAGDDTAGMMSQTEILEALEELHARFRDEEISFEEFEERKGELVARVDVG